jgi:hypothetical protein
MKFEGKLSKRGFYVFLGRVSAQTQYRVEVHMADPKQPSDNDKLYLAYILTKGSKLLDFVSN